MSSSELLKLQQVLRAVSLIRSFRRLTIRHERGPLCAANGFSSWLRRDCMRRTWSGANMGVS